MTVWDFATAHPWPAAGCGVAVFFLLWHAMHMLGVIARGWPPPHEARKRAANDVDR